MCIMQEFWLFYVDIVEMEEITEITSYFQELNLQ